ncbi:hypothetical protein AAVH_03309 [Aphelenchoides avenae]|nr:hypothetical protein AAVH_03309 [Aphelenchus avenae]
MESGKQTVQEMEPELAYEEDASFQLNHDGAASGEVMVEQHHGDFYVWDQENGASIPYAGDEGPVEYASYSDADNGGIVAPDEHVSEEAPRGLLEDVSSSEGRGEVVYNEMYGSPSGIRLHLSRNLSSTILTVEQPDGFLRQYRMTTHSKEGDALYFRCSRCESLLKNGYGDYRPKITVRDGVIQGNRFPPHHPDCHPITKQSVVIQQMDRQARVRICNDGMEPRDVYDSTKEYADEEVHADGDQFPEWNKVRKQYYRIRRLAGERSPQAGPHENVTSRVEERVLECDDELERQNNSATWKEEIVEQPGEPGEAVYYDEVPATPSTSRQLLGAELVDADGGFIEYVDEQQATSAMGSTNPEQTTIPTVSINARLARMEKVVPQDSAVAEASQPVNRHVETISKRVPPDAIRVRHFLRVHGSVWFSEDNGFSLTSEAAAAARKCRIIRVRKRAADDIEFSVIRQCSPSKQQQSSSNATGASSSGAVADGSL